MPDFPSPPGGGSTAAQIWGYATRALSTPADYKADVSALALEAGGNLAAVKGKTDGLPADPASESGAIKTETAAIKAKTDPLPASPAPSGEYDTELDVAVSTRAPETGGNVAAIKGKTDSLPASPAPANEYDTEMAHLDVDVSTRSSHLPAAIWTEATRTITALTGTPRADLIGEDATFEAATGRPAKIARLDNIPAYETPVEDSILMDGNEMPLVTKEDDKIGLLDGYVDLSTMDTDDEIVIRQSMQIKAAGAYVKYAEETYVGPQTIPLLHIITKTSKDKIKVTAQQTAIGTYRTLDVQFYRRLQA